MKRSKAILFLKAAVVVMFGGAFLWNCANITTPQGGPKDSLPPVIIGATPSLFTTNFKGKRIYLAFNEFVQLKEQQKEFFTSPPMKKTPTLTIKNKGIQIDIKDTLPENTTYSLNFGSSIRDNNEGNILNGVRYVFSTGDQIDSMFMSGYTVDASKGDSLGKTLIFFYDAAIDTIPQYDSLLLKYTPIAVARAQTNGMFVAQNLKPMDYRVYAFQDNNSNFTYDPETDKVGFLDSLCNPLRMPEFKVWFDTTRHYLTADPQLYFALFTDTRFKRQTITSSSRPEQHKVNLQFGAPYPEIMSIRFDSIAPEQIVTEYETADRDTISYWLNVPSEQLPDTLKGEVVYLKHDSISNLVPDTAKLKLFWKYFESKDEKKAREAEEKKKEQAAKDSTEYVPPVVPNPFKIDFSKSDLNPENPLLFTFGAPLTVVDTTLFSFVSLPADAAATGGGAQQAGAGQPKAGAGQQQTGQANQQQGSKAAQPTGDKEPYQFLRDTANIRRWNLTAAWSEQKKYRLTINKGALANVIGQTNDSMTIELKVMKAEKYATLNVKVVGKTPESKYVAYLLDDKGKVLQERKDVSTGTIKFKYVPAGNVKLRFLDDQNGNGKWDTGNLIERRQPERAEPYNDDKGEELIATKENWEIDITADMNKIFAPLTVEEVRARIAKMETARLKKLQEDRIKKAEEAKRKGTSGNNSSSGGGMGIGSSMSGMKNTMGGRR